MLLRQGRFLRLTVQPLRASAQGRFMTVLEGLDDAISVTSGTPPDGLELLFANRRYRHIFGVSASGHEELLAGRRGRFTDESVEVYSPGAQCWFEVHHRMLAWFGQHGVAS